ncbi:DUF397 domain-containing protein [Streptomyces bluensis]|uniref:DUF397 domain-containing protein n=1 Tax=Streptomyces bluensis TaxID=33897 RepID=UPI003318A3FA
MTASNAPSPTAPLGPVVTFPSSARRAGPAAARTSSYSGTTGGDCVGGADGRPTGAVPVRDSKNPSGPVLVVGAPAWQAFVDSPRWHRPTRLVRWRAGRRPCAGRAR